MTTPRLTKGLAAVSLAGVAVMGMSASAYAQYPPPGRSDQAPGQGNFATCPATDQDTGSPGRCGRGAQASASSGANSFDRGSQGRFGIVTDDGLRQVGTFQSAVTFDQNGAAVVNFVVPEFLANGSYNLAFLGEKDGFAIRVLVPFIVDGGAVRSASGGAAGNETFVLASSSTPGTTVPGAVAPAAAAPAAAAPAAAAPSTGTVGATTDGTVSATTSDSTGTTVAGRALPRTGSDSLVELTAAGLGLIAVGGGVVVAARRRRDAGAIAL